MIKVLLNSLTIVLIQLGIFAWYQIADFAQERWINLYYVWDKLVNVLLIVCIILKPPKTIIPFWYLIGMFFVLRCLLEIALLEDKVQWLMKFLTDYHIMFLINLICIIAILVIQRSKCRK